MPQITVRRKAARIVYEEKDVTFASKVDPPLKCCRCFPNMVNQDGFCACCYFDHSKGERECFEDPLDVEA